MAPSQGLVTTVAVGQPPQPPKQRQRQRQRRRSNNNKSSFVLAGGFFSLFAAQLLLLLLPSPRFPGSASSPSASSSWAASALVAASESYWRDEEEEEEDPSSLMSSRTTPAPMLPRWLAGLWRRLLLFDDDDKSSVLSLESSSFENRQTSSSTGRRRQRDKARRGAQQRLLQHSGTEQGNATKEEESLSNSTAAPHHAAGSANSTTSPPASSPTTTATTANASAALCRPFGLVPPTPSTRWVIGHRGASAHLPEHSLPSYRLAMELGATFVEPDLVPTADLELVAMHTPDLNVTTNVAEVYGADRMWRSPFMNQTGWFTFNFTLEELRNLTLKQRLPQARTTLSDNLYSIPTLLDVLQLVNRWNQVDRDQWSVPVSAFTAMQLEGDASSSSSTTSSTTAHAPVGVYAELKDYQWLLEDAGTNVVDLLLRHMDEYASDWTQLWNSKAHPCRASHAGLVPPLVVQSFDATVLEQFHDKWHSSNNSHALAVGEPPYVLLVGTPNCWSNDFWAQPSLMAAASSSSSSQHGSNSTAASRPPAFAVNGIGPDKSCLLDPVRGESFMNKARQLAPAVAVHPWTERPELSSLTNATATSTSALSSSVQELFHLFCECNVSGVFAEAVATAVQVAAIGCPSASTSSSSSPTGGGGGGGSAPPPTPASADGGGGEQGTTDGVDCASGGGGGGNEASSANSVPSSSAQGGAGSGAASTPVFVPIVSFLLGVAATLGVVWYRSRRASAASGRGPGGRGGVGGPARMRRRRYQIGSTSLGEDDDDGYEDGTYRNHDLELT